MFIKKDLSLIIISIILLFLCFIILFNLFDKKREPFQDTHKKIAFCFLIYDSINHEELWKKFFDGADRNKYTIYIHYKENLPLKHFEDRKLANCIPTAWGDKSLIKASNLLFKTAFEDDPANYKFVLVSNSCIPLKSFDYVYDFLTKDNIGYVNEFTDINDKFKETALYAKSPDTFAKSSQWVILNRDIVEKTAFVEEEIIDNELSNIFAPDEIYYLSYIKYHRMENQVVKTPNLSSGATTFTYWKNMSYIFPKPNAEPHAYDTIDESELKYLLVEPCLFGRKFNKNCSVVIEGKNIQLYEYITYQ